MNWILILVAAFLVGSFPTSYLLVKALRGKDIRQLGSGNPGATNVFRCVGAKEGLLVLGIDILKGFLAVSLLGIFVSETPVSDRTFALFLVIASVLGHAFTPFLKFRGGKGVATATGGGLAVYPIPLVMALLVWAIFLFGTRYMSVASIAGAYSFVVGCLIFVPERHHAAIALGIAFFITWTHRANIHRLRRGEEGKFSIR